VRAVDKAHFEWGTMPRQGFGALDTAALGRGIAKFRGSAGQPEDHLQEQG